MKILPFALLPGLLIAASNPTLWRDPGPVGSLDLAGGVGGAASAPQAPFTFIEEDKGGTAPKILVSDARGAKWSVKFGPEVKAETFATRLLWAAGYTAEPTYFVLEGAVEGAASLGRAAEFVKGGKFRDARFELRDDKVYRYVPKSSWELTDKSLQDKPELSALKLVILLLSNWDVKPANFAVVEVKGQPHYAITDWGASMGSTATSTKWDCAGFTRQNDGFVDGADGDFLSFNYSGKRDNQVNSGIRTSHVQWFMNRMGQLSDEQIGSALRASGASSEESACFTKALRNRLNQLKAASGGGVSRTIRSTTIVTTPVK